MQATLEQPAMIVYYQTNVLTLTTQEAGQAISTGLWAGAVGSSFLLEQDQGEVLPAEVAPIILRGWQLDGFTSAMLPTFARQLASYEWQAWPTQSRALIVADEPIIDQLLAALEYQGLI
jgi:hypothetical protein